VANGGRVITTMPDTWKETKMFKDRLYLKKIAKTDNPAEKNSRQQRV